MPLPAVSVWPTRAVPEIVGSDVFTGAAAVAARPIVVKASPASVTTSDAAILPEESLFIATPLFRRMALQRNDSAADAANAGTSRTFKERLQVSSATHHGR